MDMNTNQHLIHCVSSFEGTSYKNCKIQSLDLLSLVVFISFYISRHYFHKFSIFPTLSEKKIFVTNSPF